MGVAHLRTLIFSLLLAAPALAHEIGTTRVSVVFHRDHTWTAEVVGAKNLDIDARFDGVRVTPLIEVGPFVRLSGDIPSHATTFTWRNATAYATYSIAFANEGEAPARQWDDRRLEP